MPFNSAIHDACDRDDVEAVERIVSNDTLVLTSLGKFDRTPLHIAAKKGNVPICKTLLNGIHPDSLAEYLSLSTTHGFSALYCAVLSGEASLVELLISEYPVDIEAADLGGLRPLHIAAEKGYPDIVKCLVLAGCDVRAKDTIGRTALDWAAAKGNEECISLLKDI